jgi:hypothetical protein
LSTQAQEEEEEAAQEEEEEAARKHRLGRHNKSGKRRVKRN